MIGDAGASWRKEDTHGKSAGGERHAACTSGTIVNQADRNVYYCRPDTLWAREHLQALQAQGLGKKSICADPRFVDVDRDDYRLLSDSPLPGMGIETIELGRIGVSGIDTRSKQ